MERLNHNWKCRDSGIYKITCKANGKIYIGSSGSLGNRYSLHKQQLLNNKHGNRHLQRAYNKYGVDNFTFEVLELCEKNVLLDREQYYFDLLDVINPNIGYNISPNCMVINRGIKRTEEYKAKMSKSKKGQRAGIKPDNLDSIRKMTWRSVDAYYKGEKISTHETAAEAGRVYNINYKSVNNACRNLTPNMERILPGYTFRYSDGGVAKSLNRAKYNGH